jgi:hypothetical protein
MSDVGHGHGTLITLSDGGITLITRRTASGAALPEMKYIRANLSSSTTQALLAIRKISMAVTALDENETRISYGKVEDLRNITETDIENLNPTTVQVFFFVC